MGDGHIGFGGGGLLWLALIGVLIVVPFWKLLPRYGLPKWGALLAVLPLVALIYLWIMAFKNELEGQKK
jgi:O-antigen ligase